MDEKYVSEVTARNDYEKIHNWGGNAMQALLTDKKPNIAFAVHFLLVNIAQNSSCRCYVEKSDHNSENGTRRSNQTTY